MYSGYIINLAMVTNTNAPIGIFDSGIGGFSLLRHVYAALPHEHLCYFADTAYTPYGDKDKQKIIERALVITSFLVEEKRIKALIMACNTATVVSIETVRLNWPHLMVVGIEPDLKLAALQSQTGIIGVLATKSTLTSSRFVVLREQISSENNVLFLLQACVGLADQIEKVDLSSNKIIHMVKSYVAPLIQQGADTLILGCTHYSFVRHLIASSASHAGINATLIDTGNAVVQQFVRLLDQNKLRRRQKTTGILFAYTSADIQTLAMAFQNLLKLTPKISKINSE